MLKAPRQRAPMPPVVALLLWGKLEGVVWEGGQTLRVLPGKVQVLACLRCGVGGWVGGCARARACLCVWCACACVFVNSHVHTYITHRHTCTLTFGCVLADGGGVRARADATGGLIIEGEIEDEVCVCTRVRA